MIHACRWPFPFRDVLRPDRFVKRYPDICDTRRGKGVVKAPELCGCRGGRPGLPVP